MSSSSSAWEPPLPDELQRMLPQYEITGILGRGGMGAVYRGRQAKLDRDVAIKVLCVNRAERDGLPPGSPAGVSGGVACAKQAFTAGEDELNFVKRFEQEAKAMAKLDHPAIISVHDFGETSEGQLYFVMEFIDGMDIHQYLREHGGKLPQEHALAITAHVLDALDYAHDHGIVHRDIKPANILLNREGRVKIADFGLAKKFGEHADKNAPALTMSNVAVGTPDFVAPEALDSDQIPDHRADLYAVGVMLYQMLTGKLPRGLVRMPSELNPKVDPRLDEIVGKAMEPNPDYRYATAAEMRADLDLVLSQPMAKVEAGEASGEVAAVVPVTSSVKGKKVAKEASKLPVYFGIGAAACLVVGLVVMATRGGKEISEEESVLEPVITAVEERVAPASPPVKSRTGTLPVASVGETVELEETLATVTPKESPAEDTVDGVPGRRREAAPPLPVGVPPAATTEPPAPAETEPAAAFPRPTEQGTASTPPTQEPGTKNEELPAIPGLQSRLDSYLSARNGQTGDLATKYLSALETRLGQAADARDLPLATAFRDEKVRVEALKTSLAESFEDALAAVSEGADLPALPDEAPEPLVALRRVWEGAREKIRVDLDGKLMQSLKTLEGELTQSRRLDEAQAVLAYRESFSRPAPELAATPDPASSAPDSPSPDSEPSAGTLKNPFGWKPVPENPFPLPRPERPTTPCRVVAWRLDGEPVDEAEFRELFGGVPGDLGEVVDFDCSASGQSKNRGSLAIRTSGRIASMRGELVSRFADAEDVVRLACGVSVCAVLTGGGTLDYYLYHRQLQEIVPGTLEDLEKSAMWKDLVEVAVSGVFMGGLDRNGQVFLVGDNQHGQSEMPEGASRKVIAVGASGASTHVLQVGASEWSLFTFGSTKLVRKSPAGQRIFLVGSRAFAADARGEFVWSGFDPAKPLHFENLRGRKPRDVRDITVSGDLAALREGDDQWRFWGEAPPAQGGFDARYCEEKGAGAWKVLISPPFVLALKPVANLRLDDWTGVSASSATAPTRDTSAPIPVPDVKSGPVTDNPLRAAKEAPFENSLGMKFVPVPGTDVLFCIHETRWRDYAAYAEETEGIAPNWRNQTHDGFVIEESPEEHPVVYVSWVDAKAFCAWLSKKEGKTYRLPTDREWSIAVGIGREERWRSDMTPESVAKPQDLFPWGKEWPPPSGAGNYSDQSRKVKVPRGDALYLDDFDDGYPTTAPVMSFATNPHGLYDMGGNVGEWCEDLYSVEQKDRVLRGATWIHCARSHLLSSLRDRLPPDFLIHNRGFRIVLTMSED